MRYEITLIGQVKSNSQTNICKHIYICICIYMNMYMYVYVYMCVCIKPSRKHNDRNRQFTIVTE